MMKGINKEKIEDILAAVKLDELLKLKKEQEEEKENKWIKTALVVFGVVILAAIVAYAIYKFVTPDYLEDFDEDFEDDFDEDFFEDEEDDKEAESEDK